LKDWLMGTVNIPGSKIEQLKNNKMNMTNANKFLRAALLALAVAAPSTVPAQTWTTVDDFQYLAGHHSFAFGCGADGLGNFYVAGRGQDSANLNHALVMRSGDAGATWQTIEDYTYPSATATGFVKFGVDAAQNLYAMGSAALGTSGTHWLVRQSAYQAATGTWAAWQTVDDFEYATGWDSGAQAGFAEDSSGNIYVAGYAYNPSGSQAGLDVWLVRESSNGGATWQTVDTYQYDGYSTPAMGIASTPAGVFVAGSGDGHAIVRMTANAGQTWSIVDNYVYPNSGGSTLNGITVDNAGNLYTVGSATVTTVTKKGSTSQTYTVIRKGINGGTAWSTVFVTSNTINLLGGNAMGSDAAGNIYVIGRAPNWVVWKGTDAGTSWSVTDSFIYGSASEPYGCASDTLGNVYVCGTGTAANGDHWLVRKATP
jgi:hypothetical protein